jgi:hypothetical protein
VAAGGLAFAGVMVEACSGPPPPEPSPVIVATPTTVCMGDDYKTPITLDGTQSTPTLTLVPSPVDANAPPLKYLWTLTGSAYRIADVDAGDGRTSPGGTLTSDKLVVRIEGEEPLQVDLNVQNGVGGSADTTATISITTLVATDAGDAVCPLGNPG